MHPRQAAMMRAWFSGGPGWRAGERPEYMTHHDGAGHPGHGHDHDEPAGPPWRGRRGGPGLPGPGFGAGFGPGGPGFGPGFGPGGRGGPWAWARAFGGPAGAAAFGGPGHKGGRARRGDVRAAILVLLEEGPKHGYQLITEFEEKTQGRWKPSPGSVYPVLSQLSDEGLVRPEDVDGRRVFHLTDTGRTAAAEARERHGDRLWGEDEGGHGLPPVMESFAGLAAAAWQVAQAGDPAQIERARVVLDEARRALYRVLADDPSESGQDSSADPEPGPASGAEVPGA
jgi:DNA-binding PadR family transcriptional regulator